ncbi:iron ABC transporter substrate-binding protein [Roseomonas haemaphysalidis]|uniref:Iron ABC transporter substrate-binding protein n=1 Tax=Roseomonas haemaphysalidis TaxID=2768162 RepID=A0ABS3KPD0_9PROT|nr:iron ABC transporter substrate-binding protein [Roseomonas haemaphysalidis]MBO1079305.1 iron ABC transporter substrate-binding protein [Roseomonas haemaphysalidis]
MTIPRRGVAALLAAGASSLLARSGRAQAAGELLVYNAQHASLTKEWVNGFTAETGVKVTVRNGGDTELANQIVQEGAASPADVFLTENSPAMALVQSANLFAPLDDTTLGLVPAHFRPAQGRWMGIAARSTVFAYDTRKLTEAQLPKSIMDLADPSWKGRWAASPSGADFQAIVGAMLQLKGEAATLAWLQGMKQNFVAYRGNSTCLKAVNAGEIPGAVIYHYYFFGDQAKTGENSNNVQLHYFRNQDPGAFVSISGGGVLASSRNQAQAQAFLRWVAGPKGQGVLRTGDSFEYAVGNGQASHPKLVPLAELQAPDVQPATLDSRAVSALMTKAGLL